MLFLLGPTSSTSSMIAWHTGVSLNKRGEVSRPWVFWILSKTFRRARNLRTQRTQKVGSIYVVRPAPSTSDFIRERFTREEKYCRTRLYVVLHGMYTTVHYCLLATRNVGLLLLWTVAGAWHEWIGCMYVWPFPLSCLSPGRASKNFSTKKP